MMSAAMERLDELLTDRALVGLAPEETYELDRLLREHPHVDAASYERAAAATALASMRIDPMPSHLFARIEADAVALLAHRPSSSAPQPVPGSSREALAATVRQSEPARPRAHLARTAPMNDAPVRPVAPSAPPPPAPAPLAPNVPPLRPVPYVTSAPQAPRDAQAPAQPAPSNVVPLRTGPSRVFAVSGWVAAAAVLVIAIGAYLLKKPDTVASVPPVPSTAPSLATVPSTAPSALASSMPPSAAEGRAKLLATTGTVRLDWTPTKDAAAVGASGDVVWNPKEQKGYMRFSGLAKNDPKGTQYQLWIFDKTRDDKYPVDGGVFDVDRDTGDVVVPITARLPVADATLFAVTVEKPGGVVVSKRERIVVTAKPVG